MIAAAAGVFRHDKHLSAAQREFLCFLRDDKPLPALRQTVGLEDSAPRAREVSVSFPPLVVAQWQDLPDLRIHQIQGHPPREYSCDL